MSPLRPLPFLALALAAGCTLEPDFAGAQCLSGGACPAGYYCEPESALCQLEPEVNPCSVNRGGCSPQAACKRVGPRVTCECWAGWVGDGGTCVQDEAAIGGLEVGVSYGGSPPAWTRLQLEPVFNPGVFDYRVRVSADGGALGLRLSVFSVDTSLKVNGQAYSYGAFWSFAEVARLPTPPVLIDVTATTGQQHRFTVTTIPP